ncbi:tRNA dihydrouridine synthase DusB [Ornithinibacillus halotolerans]|uniref:tRNA-dihydrouridine synthase n=1 Tax=Ornithinibacillus halotolerans TaxID=1274357 RepID=A0A916RVF9_9BACI|nr:tRNA dihydrouridine synthase DusB [Ornithinibacillus halotolerans]GGA71083.1 putative tRNA-dihydrouridine synthase 1 [Ornithinibacillus halotolerans]
MWKIRDITIPNQVTLAPMAGVSNWAFRLTVKEFGAGLITAEMVSDKGILNRNKNTMKMLYIDEQEMPMSLQIFGGDKDNLVQAAQYVDQNTNASIIDINMGCPAPKITKVDAGSRWLLDPDKIYQMVKAVVENTDKPVTVKMRTGWDEDHIFAVDNAKAVEAAGGSAIGLHGRTRKQMYEGYANWDIIKDVKSAVSIPIIGNGDIDSPEIAKQRIDETGVDAVMIGRAALGNPWIIYQIVKYLDTGILIDAPTPQEKIDVCILHMDRLIKLKGEKVAIMEMRKHAAWYLKGIDGSGKARKQINQAETRDHLINIFFEFVKEVEEAMTAS